MRFHDVAAGQEARGLPAAAAGHAHGGAGDDAAAQRSQGHDRGFHWHAQGWAVEPAERGPGFDSGPQGGSEGAVDGTVGGWSRVQGLDAAVNSVTFPGFSLPDPQGRTGYGVQAGQYYDAGPGGGGGSGSW